MILPDYSEYLNKAEMLDWIEKEWIAKPETHEEHARIVNETVEKFKLKQVLEIGCGTGEVGMRLNVKDIDYVGLDNNVGCIEIAREKDRGSWSYRIFDVNNIRTFSSNNDPFDLVFAFAFLKHFGLHEWKEIFNKLASLGDYLIFDMPIAVETKDDGTEYHHVWMNLDELKRYIKDAGFELLEMNNFNPDEPVFICKRKKS